MHEYGVHHEAKEVHYLRHFQYRLFLVYNQTQALQQVYQNLSMFLGFLSGLCQNKDVVYVYNLTDP